MRAWAILVFFTIVNAAFGVAGSITVAGSTTPAFYSANVVTYPGINASAIQNDLGCTSYQNGSMICTPSTPNANILSIAGVFGDFIDGLHILITMATGIILPYFFVSHFLSLIGVSGTLNIAIAGIFNLVMMVTYGALLIYVISARDPEGIG